MCIKATLQIEICNRFDKVYGFNLYKTIIALVLEKIARFTMNKFDDDLKLQIIKKIAKRAYKLDKMKKTDFIESTIEKCKQTVKEIREELDRNLKAVIANQEYSTVLEQSLFNKNDYIHDFNHIKEVIHDLFNQKLNIKSKSKTFACNERNLLTIDLSEINIDLIDETTLNLLDIENWVLNHSFGAMNSTSLLFNLLDRYVEKATNFYDKDEIGYSRMILTSVKLICAIDSIALQDVNLLREHNIGFKSNILEDLLLPKLKYMIVANDLKTYINKRNNIARYESVFDKFNLPINEFSFSVVYSKNNSNILNIKNKIISEANARRDEKISEINSQKEVYKKLTLEYNSLRCKCQIISNCERCSVFEKAENMKTLVYEWPIPKKENDIFAVLFELAIPEAICNLRDSLYILHEKILKIKENLQKPVQVYGLWIEQEIKKHLVRKPKYVTLGSTTKSIMQSHYSCLHPKESIENFLPQNGFTISLCDTNLKQIDYKNKEYSYKSFCTMKLFYPYKNLQWSINDTSENCCLQIRNLLESLISRNISFNNLSVNSLISQTLWQICSIDFEKNTSFIPSAHLDFTNVEYLDRLHDVLNELLNDIQKKWNDNLILYNSIIIILRVISICPSSDVINKMVISLKRCRTIANQWADSLKEIIQNEKEIEKKHNLKIELIKISLYSILTFNVDQNREKHSLVMSTTDDLVSWFISMETVNRYKNIFDKEKEVFLENLLRQAYITALNIAQHFLKLIEFDGSSLTNFVKSIWPDSCLGKFGKWKLLNDGKYPFWFSISFERYDQASMDSYIHININGEFLINYFPMGKLPNSILKHKEFIRFFEKTDFDVQPASEGIGSFVSTIKTSSSTELNYTFYEVNSNLIVIERNNDYERQLIPSETFKDHLPLLFIDNYSHWYNKRDEKIEFRNKTISSYLDSFKKSDPIVKYSIDLKESTLTDHLDQKLLISFQKQTVKEINKKLTKHLEEDHFVHIFRDIVATDFIYIKFPRLDLNLKLEKSKNTIWSCDHSNFKVDDKQDLNTLNGLDKYLILIENKEFPIRKLIIPHGSITTSIEGINKNVSIKFDEQRKPAVFSYIIDENLRRLKAEDSNTAWLYLALLHGCTANVIPDSFTGLTGTKMALHLLESAICWSTKDYSKESRIILEEIKNLSPKRTFYPENLKVMQQVHWPNGISPLCASENFHFIAEKLLEDSNRLYFAFQTEKSDDENQEKTDEFLSQRAKFRNDKLSLDSKVERTNFDFKIQSKNVVFKKEIREIATSSYFPGNISLVHLVFTCGDFDLSENKYKSLEEFSEESISKWFQKTDVDVSLKFSRKWYDLFDFSRKIDSKDLVIKLDFILSYLAYKNIDLDKLLIFQRIVNNRLRFSKDRIADPPLEKYDLSAGRYCKVKISHFLNSNYHSCEKFKRNCPSKNYDITKEKDIENIESQISNYRQYRFIPDSLRCLFYEHFSYDTFDELKKLCTSWYDNQKLREFLEKVEFVSQSLERPIKKPLLEINCNQHMKVFKSSPIKVTYTFGIKDDNNSLLEEANEIFEQKTPRYHEDIHYFCTRPILRTETHKNDPEFEIDSNCKLSELYFDNIKKSLEYHRTSISEKFDLNLLKIIENNKMKEKIFNSLIVKFTNFLSGIFGPKNEIESCLEKAQILPETMNPLIFLRFLLNQSNDLNCLSIKNVIGAFGVLISLRSQAIRCIKLAKQEHTENQLKKELSNKPFKNWSPNENPEWLLIQLELDIIIRESQVDVARKMISPPNNQNTVIQMNMGEGKTAVIIPLLIATQADGKHLIRLIVLKSLMNINYNSLVFKLGNLLNKRVYILPFNREINTDSENLSIYHKILKECLAEKHVVLTLAEYCLSFKLKTIESCRPGSLFNLEEASKLIDIQKWLEKYSKDILDESDEILSVKYQLVYSVGTQSILDGGKLRWEVAQNILKLASSNLKKLKDKYPDSIEYIEKSSCIQAFPTIRLLNMQPYEELVQKICYDFFNRLGIDLDFVQYTAEDIRHLTNYVRQKQIDDLTVNRIKELDAPALNVILLILRGLLTNDILYTALNKRWKVDYGVNLSGYKNLLQAVPYRAKDVPAERSQFAHPDIAILKTYLTYYYGGLNDKQLEDLFKLLENDKQGFDHYNKWIQLLPKSVEIDPSIRDFSCLNLADSSQKLNFVFPILRMHPPVINHWLCTFLFPKEAKEFSNKLSTSAWDICSLNKNLTTGFSGTNDSSQYLLPLNMKYHDLPNLIGTTGSVIENILSENNKYTSLSGNENEEEIVDYLVKHRIKVLLDPGALMVKLSNKKLVKKWLSLCEDSQIEAAVFFENNDLVVIKKNSNEINLFETSIYQQLNKCLIYLDDIHTRGTDLKVPMNTVAAVTLGKGLVKDRFFQACMRMRMLGDGHSLIFVASKEVHNELLKEKLDFNKPINSLNVLQWTINNGIKQLKNDSLYWAHQGSSFYLKKTSYDNFVQTLPSKQNLNSYFYNCKESSTNQLKFLYGNDRVEMLITDIILKRLNNLMLKLKKADICTDSFKANNNSIINKLIKQIPDLKKHDQLINEEMELEIEKETEEQNQVERPKKAESCKNILDSDVISFASSGVIKQCSSSIIPFMKSFKKSSLETLVEEHAWSNKIFVTRDFLETVQTNDFDNYYLRLPRWIAINKTKNIYLIISGYEANELFSLFKDQVTLFMFIPRVRHDQKLVSFPAINMTIETRLELLIFCGSIYFENIEEQNAFTSFAGYLPSPRASNFEKKFNQKLITPNGYVPSENRTIVFDLNEDKCLFGKDPSDFIIKLGEIRNYALVPNSAHHLVIFLNGKKPIDT